MGLEVIFGVISAVVGVVGGIAQANAASQAAAAQKEANNVQSAQQKVASAESRRQKVREERIRRAQIIASSENSGTTNSSGSLGAQGALATNLAGMVSFSQGESRANSAYNSNMQRAADFTSQANTIGAWTNTIQNGIGGFQTIFDKKD